MLKQLEYDEFLGKPKQWTLAGLTLGQVNLLVGQNAIGKTRCLNVLHNLAIQLSQKAKIRTLGDCRFRIQLEEADTSITYFLRYTEGSIDSSTQAAFSSMTSAKVSISIAQKS